MMNNKINFFEKSSRVAFFLALDSLCVCLPFSLYEVGFAKSAAGSVVMMTLGELSSFHASIKHQT